MKIKYCLFFLSFSTCLPILAGAQAGTTLLVKTDMSCNWKLDGHPMGLLKEDEPKLVLVSPGEHLIEAFGEVGGITDMTRVEVDKVEKTVFIQLKYKNDRKLETQQSETPKKVTGADAASDATWTDPATALMWTGKDNGGDVDWDQAGEYCSKLRLAGYSGWRLPTVEELQGIYDARISTPALFNNQFMVNLHVKGNLKLTGWIWSGLQGDHPGKPYQNAWLFQFDGSLSSPNVGKPLNNFLHFSWDMRALCVRSAAGDVSGR